MGKIILNTKYFILNTLIFLFPFFFLKTTQEFFITNKFYLLGFGILFLLFISLIQFIFSKKISWQKRPFDNLILLFLTSVALSTLFSSPNKIQALLNPSFGLVMMIFLAVLYFYVSRGPSLSDKVGPHIMKAMPFSSFILSLITIIFYFQPFKNIGLPQNFTPVGSQLDLAIILGFFLIIQILYLLIKKQYILHSSLPVEALAKAGFLILNFLALFLTVYPLLKPIQPTLTDSNRLHLILPPFRLSWFAALEIFKNPLTAIIGVGPDNFSVIFTRVKDFAYNQSPLWQINSFNVSHSAILQILTETGIFGLISFCILIFTVFKSTLKQWSNETMKPLFFIFVYLIICLFVLPPSLIVWFLFFVVLGLISQQWNNGIMKQSINLSDSIPLYLGLIIISLGLISTSGYFLGRSYLSEYYFKKSQNGIVNNNLKQVYDNQRQAIILNPFIERFRSSFSQTNLAIANNLSSKNKDKKMSEQDRQTITQAIQAGIAEGKAVVSLNPHKADNWQNLATIYFHIINTATGSDAWAISSYQRALLADPQNPNYMVGLGGVYYSQKKYDDALIFFEKAVSLKPDWSNANYNLAWANFQKHNYSQAVNAMQNTLRLIDPKTNKTNYEKVQKELEEFKKVLPK